MATDAISFSPADVAVIEQFVRIVASAGYTDLLINTMTGTILIPFFIALLYFSTEKQRSTPIFCCVMLGVAMGIAQAVVAIYLLLYSMHHPFVRLSISGIIGSMLLTSLTTYVIDIALLFRVVAVYPLSTTPRSKFLLIMTLPAVLKILRVVEWVVWSVDAARLARIAVDKGYNQSPLQRQCIVIRCALAFVDNSYITAIFLWKLRSSFATREHRVISVGTESLGHILRRRVRTLFWFALSNFVFPVPLFLAQLVLIATGSPTVRAYDILNILVGFVSIICAVFATVWRSVEHTESSTELGPHSGPLRFRIPTSSGLVQSPDDMKSASVQSVRVHNTREELELDRIIFAKHGSSNGTDKDFTTIKTPYSSGVRLEDDRW